MAAGPPWSFQLATGSFPCPLNSSTTGPPWQKQQQWSPHRLASNSRHTQPANTKTGSLKGTQNVVQKKGPTLPGNDAKTFLRQPKKEEIPRGPVFTGVTPSFAHLPWSASTSLWEPSTEDDLGFLCFLCYSFLIGYSDFKVITLTFFSELRDYFHSDIW